MAVVERRGKEVGQSLVGLLGVEVHRCLGEGGLHSWGGRDQLQDGACCHSAGRPSRPPSLPQSHDCPA